MHKLLHAFLIAACSGFLAYQAYRNIDTYLQHKTATRKASKTLSQDDLPSIEICLNPGFDTEVLQSYGYKNLPDYIVGKSNGSFIGWAGNGTGTTNDLLDKAYIWKNRSDILDLQGSNIGNNKKSWDLDKVFVESAATHPYGKCFVLNTSYLMLQQKKEPVLSFKLKALPKTKVLIFISDQNRKSWKRDVFSYSGDKIEYGIDPSSKKYNKHFELQISETIDSDKDMEANCMDYSASAYGQYGKCALAKVHNYFFRHISCIPPWFLGQDNKNMCQYNLTQNFSARPLDIWYFLNKIAIEVGMFFSQSCKQNSNYET